MNSLISQITKAMIFFFDGDIKRINHALKVHSYAKLIGELEKISFEELFIVEVSAILHDVGIKISEEKYNSSSGKYQELEGPPVAKELLSAFKIDSLVLDRILHIIGHHHSYDKIDSLDFQILVEADFLVNIFEDEVPHEKLPIIKNKIFKTPSGLEILKSIYKI